MTKSRKSAVPTEHFLAHGYWDHPDPAVTIRELLAKHPRLLAGFGEAYEEEDGSPGLIAEWAESEGAPPEVRDLIARAYASEDGEYFDAVQVASGGGPDGGGMITWECRLYAYRRDGWIHYHTHGDGSAPKPTRMPLTIDEVYEVVAGGDMLSVIDYAPDAIAELLGSEAPSRGEIEAAVDRKRWSAAVSSEFYDFSKLEEDMRRMVLSSLLARYGLDKY